MLAPEEPYKFFSSCGVERFWVDATSGGYRDADLLEVRTAIRAVAEVVLESTSLPPRKGSVEVCGHEFDGLLTHEVLAQQCHRHVPPNRQSRADRIRVLPRWSNTRWFASVIERSAQTSLLDSPSTSRKITTCCWGAGSPSITCLA